MKLRVNRQELSDALSAVTGVVAARTPKPILQCVLIETQSDGVVLSCTDLEVGIRFTVSQVEVERTGSTLVKAETLNKIVRESADDTLELDLQENLHIKGEGSHFQIVCSNVEDFPKVPNMEEEPDFRVAGEHLQQLIEWTMFACAKESTRYAINGVLIELQGKQLTLVATDGRRLARAVGAVEKEESGEIKRVIAPVKALSLFSRHLAGGQDFVWIKMAENQLMIGSSQATISSSLVEGKFPPYNDVIPADCDKKATIDSNRLLSALRKAALLTNEESRGVRLSFQTDRLTLSSRVPEQGEAEIFIPISYNDDACVIGFNPNFLIDALKVVRSDDVTFSLSGPKRPGLLEANSMFAYVVMPVDIK